jgi:peroxiredoxin
MLQTGARAPEFTLNQVQGGPVALSEVLGGGQHALLIFLRYLG